MSMITNNKRLSQQSNIDLQQRKRDINNEIDQIEKKMKQTTDVAEIQTLRSRWNYLMTQ